MWSSEWGLGRSSRSGDFWRGLWFPLGDVVMREGPMRLRSVYELRLTHHFHSFAAADEKNHTSIAWLGVCD